MTKSSGQLCTKAPIVVACLLLTTPTSSQGQSIGDAEAGRTLAKAWCSECHSVEPGQTGVFRADFREVANLPSTTALSLRVFLQSSHKEMPNFSLKPGEANDIIAYILSLKNR